MTDLLALAPAVFAVALVYASVGHGGASGYLAVMALAGIAPNVMSSGALLLNLVVAGIAFAAFRNAGHNPGKLVTPFLIGSVPTAILGSMLNIPRGLYNWLLAVVLLAAAIRMFVLPAVGRLPWADRRAAAGPPGVTGRRVGPGLPFPALPESAWEDALNVIRYDITTIPTVPIRILIGGLIGLVSGIVGVGGGILLSPLLLWRRWAGVRMTASASAIFIVVNSIAGIAGRVAGHTFDPTLALPVFAAAAIGGFLGGRIGAEKLPVPALRRVLAGVLLIAAAGKVLR